MAKGYWIVRVDITALNCWKSPEYQEVMKIRLPVSIADVVVIEGYEGPQPGG